MKWTRRLGAVIIFGFDETIADEQAVSQSIRSQDQTSIVLSLAGGTGSARFWTTDRTAECVRLNADYRP